jgi:hypothetical protein
MGSPAVLTILKESPLRVLLARLPLPGPRIDASLEKDFSRSARSGFFFAGDGWT